MPRGYRCIILAAVGWLILAGSPPRQGTEAKQPEPRSAQSAPAANAPSPVKSAEQANEHDKPCGEGERNRKSDLCAQWVAADAAADAAYWARLTFWLGTCGSVLGAITMCAAIAAAIFAKQAAVHTESGANAANDQVRLAREAQRPWISLNAELSLFKLTLDKVRINYDILCKNIGTSPAYNVEVVATIKYLSDNNFIEEIGAIQSAFRSAERSSKRALIPGDVATYSGETYAMTERLPWEGVATREAVLCDIIVHVSYNTTFDTDVHRSEQSFLVGKRGNSFMDRRYLHRTMRRDNADTVQISRFVSGEVS